MVAINQNTIDDYRSQFQENQDILAGLDVIQQWDGDLANAAESIATRNGIEGVEDNAVTRWFFSMLLKIRDITGICKSDNFRENYLPALIPPIADLISSTFGLPSGIAGILATPFAIYIKEEGLEKFCNMSLS